MKFIQNEIHQTAVDHGWWEGADQRIVPEKLMLIVSEIAEGLEEYRNGHLEACYYSPEGKPEGLGIELSDAIIRILDLGAWLGYDMDDLVRLKHSFNADRPYRHGGKLC